MNASLKVVNIEKALNTLQKFAATVTPTEIERAGIIQAFEFCFELYWKFFQKISELEGDTIGGPKPSLKAAFKRKILVNEDIWINMLNDRNQSVHAYNEQVAEEIYRRISELYLKEFSECLNNIRIYLKI